MDNIKPLKLTKTMRLRYLHVLVADWQVQGVHDSREHFGHMGTPVHRSWVPFS